MQASQKLSRSCSSRYVGQLPSAPYLRPQRHVAVRSQEPFNEGAAQVRRLVNRDRKEFLGNDVDILDQYTTEFGDVGPRKDGQRPNPGAPAPPKPSTSPAAAAASSAAAAPAPSQPASPPQPSTSKPPPPAAAPGTNPFKSTSSDNPFGPENPFGAPSTISPFGNSGQTKSKIEPEGLRPDMGPDAVTRETPFDIIKDITLTQVVLFFSFTLIILLMIGTFYVVLQSGAIRLNGYE